MRDGLGVGLWRDMTPCEKPFCRRRRWATSRSKLRRDHLRKRLGPIGWQISRKVEEVVAVSQRRRVRRRRSLRAPTGRQAPNFTRNSSSTIRAPQAALTPVFMRLPLFTRRSTLNLPKFPRRNELVPCGASCRCVDLFHNRPAAWRRPSRATKVTARC